MKHSPPFIPEGVGPHARAMASTHAVGIVMAPHWSGMSVETYIERVQQAVEDHGTTPAFTFVRRYHDHPAFIDVPQPNGCARPSSLVPGGGSRPTRR